MRVPDAIETARLRLRRHRRKDEDAFVQFMTDEEATRFLLLTAGERSEAGARARFGRALNLYEAAEPVFSLTIAEKETDAFVGACGLNPIAEEPAAREIFYDVIVDRQGKGYAREASEALVDHAMKEAGIPKLVAFLRPENTRAVAVAEYLGFEDHGPAMKHGRPGRRYVLSGTRTRPGPA